MKLEIICAIRNTLTLMIFAGVARHFDNWWLIFGAAVFWCWTENKNIRR